MKSIELFMQFFRREGWVYAIGLTMLIAIDIAFLFVPQFIGNAIDTLSHNKEGLVNYIIYFIIYYYNDSKSYFSTHLTWFHSSYGVPFS